MQQVDNQRRIFLKGTLATGVVGALVSAGLISPQRALAAAWPKTAFTAPTTDEALSALFADGTLTESDKITLKAPDIAENGAVVPVTVSTDMANVESISIFIDKNPSPLAASFEIPTDAVADVSTRVKMGETSNMLVVVKAGGQLLTTQKEVKVTIGGCGG